MLEDETTEKLYGCNTEEHTESAKQDVRGSVRRGHMISCCDPSRKQLKEDDDDDVPPWQIYPTRPFISSSTFH